MNFSATKKTFISLLMFFFFFSFLPSTADSNFTAPVLNPSDLAFNGPVHAIVRDEMTGIVYVGGQFTKVGEKKRNNLAAIGPDGTLLNWNPNADKTVNALAIKDSTIYVGGYFTKIGRKRRNKLAAIGTNGTLQKWNPNVGGGAPIISEEGDKGVVVSFVNALAISGSTVYVGGYFASIRGIERNSLAAI